MRHLLTYASIDIVHEAQKLYDLPDFDLIICDEAHLTTGAIYDGKGGLPFVRVHDNDFIRAKKRLYMTATPHIYMTPTRRNSSSVLSDGIELYPMDDETIYGQTLYVLSFSNAVAQGLIVDYKVLIQIVNKEDIYKPLETLLIAAYNSTGENDIKLQNAAKVVACWKALAKHGLKNPGDPDPMKRAVAFCQLIEKDTSIRQHRVSSKQIAQNFSAVVEAYQEFEKNDAPQEGDDNASLKMVCRVQHVDASMSAGEKHKKLQWLKGDSDEKLPENECRILSNVRCLSNGADVPALDAIMYLNPRKSQVDVVESVGHITRVAPGKQKGYIILPVVIPLGVSTEDALEDESCRLSFWETHRVDTHSAAALVEHNKLFKNARVVWQVLNALRAHDDRFDVMINQLEFNHRLPSQIEIISVSASPPTRDARASDSDSAAVVAKQSHDRDINPNEAVARIEQELRFEADVYKRALLGTIVKRCKNRQHWEKWTKDIANIARAHYIRIIIILNYIGTADEINAFNGFAEDLRNDLKEAVTDNGIVELLAQHQIAKPVFDAIFGNDQFTSHNPMSQAIEELLAKLQAHNLDKECEVLKAFSDSEKIRERGAESRKDRNAIIHEIYDKVFFENERLIYHNPVPQAMEALVAKLLAHRSDKKCESLESFCDAIKMRLRGIESAEGKKRFIREIYHKVFRSAFLDMAITPKMITAPIEVVDFIIHSVEDVLRSEFQSSLANDGVHILDPFAGTGIFITRLLESGIIPKDKLTHKYQHEIHANEDILLSYYMAAANIEASFHGIMSPQIADSKGDGTQKNEQVYLPFRGICLSDSLHAYKKDGIFELKDNSARRKAQDQLDIAVIMANPPSQTRYDDDHVAAIRWACDRIGDQGIVAFICDGGFLDNKTSDGLRKYLAEAYSSLYIFHLGGDYRSSGKRSPGEKSKILTLGNREPDVILILVKNPTHSVRGQIYFYDIGDDLSRDKKLSIIKDFGSIDGIDQKVGWTQFRPNIYHDWLKQRDPKFNSYLEMGTKHRKNAAVIFETYSNGLKTRRGPWIYNASKEELQENVQKLIGAYDDSLQNYKNLCRNSEPENWHEFFKFTEPELSRLQWTDRFHKDLEQHKEHRYLSSAYATSLYRPFTKQHVYYDPDFIEKVYQIPQIFPNADAKNLLMILSPHASTKAFSVLMTDALPDFNTIYKGQCFPLYHYESADESEDKAFKADNDDLSAQKDAGAIQHTYRRRDAISDAALAHFQAAYPKRRISKEALFYYVYGLLHSNDYHETYAQDLLRQLPRIPCVASYADFKAFGQIGRKLADLHINYESGELYPVRFTGKLKHNGHDFVDAEPADFYVTKMRHPKRSCPETGKKINVLSRIVYNDKITIDGIPEAAYDYIVNGKPAIEWVIKQQGANTHAASRIDNDTNDWAIETAQNPRYPLELLLRVISLSLKTIELVKKLPALKLLPE